MNMIATADQKLIVQRSSKGEGTHGADDTADGHATRLLHRVCCLAGEAELISEIRADNQALRSAILRHDTPLLFDWLMVVLSYQGISDKVAHDYMDQHDRVTWHDVERALGAGPSCPKLQSYWHFNGCLYHKTSATCAEPDHIAQCPLPAHVLRNGRLNQTAYSLYLFIRDIAQGDIVGWIEMQLASSADPADPARLSRMREALLAPLRHVYGVSDKVLSMALSVMLVAAPKAMRWWAEVGASMIAIDTLVHNFMVRTGILRRITAEHPYGPACYQPKGCADIIQLAAATIDARQFNPRFPKVFPRFVQRAIWRYCAEGGLNVCNGNRIDDDERCNNVYCRMRKMCDRVALRQIACPPRPEDWHYVPSSGTLAQNEWTVA
jgi:hypothetical protein